MNVRFQKKSFIFLAAFLIDCFLAACDGSDNSGCDPAPNDTPTTDPGDNPGDTPTIPMGSIEDTYAADGAYSVATTQVSGYQIFHLGNMSGDHPISYYPILRHLAFWGNRGFSFRHYRGKRA